MNMVSSGSGMAASPVLIAPGGHPALADPLARAYDLPCTLVLEAPVIGFSVGSLMQLCPGTIVRTAAQQNEDIALKVNGQFVGLVEFDVVGERLAIRVTGMA